MSKSNVFGAKIRQDGEDLVVSFKLDRFIDSFVHCSEDSDVWVEDGEGNQFAVKKNQLFDIECLI